MELQEFHNALRILRSIDRHELEEAGLQLTDNQWLIFCHGPHDWFLRASDDEARKVWKIIEERMKP